MDVVSTLQELGFTEYEAKVYCALVKFPGSTGYEIGGHSKVPRARVYEVLEGLQDKGLAYPQTVDGKQVYYPQPHRTMLLERKERLTQVADFLDGALDRIASASPEPQFLVFKGTEQVFSKIRQICRDTKAKLVVAGWPEDLVAFGQDLRTAQDRGAGVYVLSYGEVDLPVSRVFHHSVSPLQYLQVAVIGRWLQVVSDLNECFIVQISGPDKTVGLMSKSPALAFAVAQWVNHDISFLVYAEEFGATEPLALSTENQALLREILEWKPGQAGSEADLPAGAPGVTSVFDEMRRRLLADPARAYEIGGVYEFRISGDDGGVYHVTLTSGLIYIAEGHAQDPELIIELSSCDFRAMALGVLPLGALYTPGRIRLRGDIVLAGRIQSLLHA